MTVTNGVTMDLKCVLAIFKIVRDGNAFSRKFLWFADRHTTCTEVISECRRENEAPCFNTNDRIYFLSFKLGSKRVDSISQAFRMFQQRCDVVKVNARFGKVRNFADELF